MIHSNPIPDTITREMFEAHIRVTERGCIEWTGDVNPKGYGRLGVDGKKYQAHRISLHLAGVPMPDGMVVDHLCRNRRCVNISHLEVTTQQINTARGISPNAPRSAARLDGRCVNGHVLAEVGTHRQGNRGVTCAECGRERVRRYMARKRGGGRS